MQGFFDVTLLHPITVHLQKFVGAGLLDVRPTRREIRL